MKSEDVMEYKEFNLVRITGCGEISVSGGRRRPNTGDNIITLFYGHEVIQVVISGDEFHEMMLHITKCPTGRRGVGSYLIKWQKKHRIRQLKTLPRERAYLSDGNPHD